MSWSGRRFQGFSMNAIDFSNKNTRVILEKKISPKNYQMTTLYNQIWLNLLFKHHFFNIRPKTILLFRYHLVNQPLMKIRPRIFHGHSAGPVSGKIIIAGLENRVLNLFASFDTGSSRHEPNHLAVG